MIPISDQLFPCLGAVITATSSARSRRPRTRWISASACRALVPVVGAPGPAFRFSLCQRTFRVPMQRWQTAWISRRDSRGGPASRRSQVGDQFGQRSGGGHIRGDVTARPARRHRPCRRAPPVRIDRISGDDADVQVHAAPVNGLASQRRNVGIRQTHPFIAPPGDQPVDRAAPTRPRPSSAGSEREQSSSRPPGPSTA